MTEAQRNTAVGVFVLIGFGLLAGIILQFSNIALFARGGYRVEVTLDHSAGAMAGKPVHFNGVDVGVVTDVGLAADGMSVIMGLRINDGVKIPNNAIVHATATSLGDVYIDIALPRKLSGERAAPGPFLPTDGSGRLTSITGGSQLVPKSLTDKIEQFMSRFDRLDQVLTNLTLMTEPRSLADVDAGKVQPNLWVAVARFDAATARMADEENARHLKEILAQLAVSTGRLNDTLKKADEFFDKASYATTKASADFAEIKEQTVRVLGKAYDDAKRLSDLLDTWNSMAKAVQEGQGTIGKLLVSDELHKQLSLVLTEFAEAAKAVTRTVTKWEKKGLFGWGG